MFRVMADAPSKLIEMYYGGFLEADEIDRSFRDEQALVRQMGCASEQHVLLIDAREIAAQSQSVVAEIISTVAQRPLRARRAAIVAKSALSQLQLKRIVNGDTTAQLFADHAQARRWLLS